MAKLVIHGQRLATIRPYTMKGKRVGSKYKSPAKTAVMAELRATEADLHRWRIIHAERQACAREAILQEREAFAELLRLGELRRDHYEALADVERADRAERRRTAA